MSNVLIFISQGGDSVRRYKKPKAESLKLGNTCRPKFKILRHGKGSQRYVGDRIGVSDVSIRQFENGETAPGLFTAFKCSLYLEATLEELFPDLFKSAQVELEALTVVS